MDIVIIRNPSSLNRRLNAQRHAQATQTQTLRGSERSVQLSVISQVPSRQNASKTTLSKAVSKPIDSGATRSANREDFAKAIQEAGMHIMEKQDIPAFAQCATSGYKNYPLFNYFCGGSYDEKQALALWHVLLGSLSKDAVCYSDAPDPKGFAIWIPASYQGSSVIEFILAGGLKLPALMGLGVFSRLLRYENHAQRIRMDLTNGKGWYFYNLVTRADCQGMGIGGSLIRPALKLMDSAGDIAYLETHKDTNVPLYERFGFQLLETSIAGGKEALQHYAMLREPVR